MRWRSYVLHLLLGVLGTTSISWVIGLAVTFTTRSAEAYVLGPSFALPLLLGLLVGAFAASQSEDKTSQWVWVPLGLCLLYALVETSTSPGVTVPRAFLEYLGPRCGGTDCLGQFLISTPFAVSSGYSIGAGLYFLAHRH
jgi:hypothetical protein